MRDRNALLKLVQKAIDDGASSAEEIHKSIARLPLKVLAEVGALKKPVKEMDRIQDLAIGSLYELIRDINERVAGYAARLLAKTGKDAPRGAKPAARKTAARKPAARAANAKKRPAPAKRRSARA
jgi:hypothetical protein